jgi:hypothetical protein
MVAYIMQMIESILEFGSDKRHGITLQWCAAYEAMVLGSKDVFLSQIYRSSSINYQI